MFNTTAKTHHCDSGLFKRVIIKTAFKTVQVMSWCITTLTGALRAGHWNGLLAVWLHRRPVNNLFGDDRHLAL